VRETASFIRLRKLGFSSSVLPNRVWIMKESVARSKDEGIAEGISAAKASFIAKLHYRQRARSPVGLLRDGMGALESASRDESSKGLTPRRLYAEL